MQRTGLIAAAWITASCLVLAAHQQPPAQEAQQPPQEQPQPQEQQPQQQEPQAKPPAQAEKSSKTTAQPAAEAASERPRSTTARRLEGMKPSAQVSGQQPLHVALVTGAGKIASNPRAFYGVRVSVHARVAEAFNRYSFTLDDDQWWRWGDDLLVLVPQPQPNVPLDDDDFVTVVGTVQPFVRAEMERDYDWFDFDTLPDINIELEGRPVIVAEIARTSDGAILAQPSQDVTHVFLATPGQIAETPGRFYGRNVVVRQEIESVWSPRVFTLDEDQWFAGPDLLVFNPDPIALSGTFGDYDGEHVTIFGTVRPFLAAEFDQDYDWFNANDYERHGIEEWERRPALVASSIVTDERLELVSFRPEFALDRTEAGMTSRAAAWPQMTARFDRERQSAQQAQAKEQTPAPQPQPQERQSEPQTLAAPGTEPLRAFDSLMVSDATPLVGREVVLDRVRIVRVLEKDRRYAVGTSTERSVTVRLAQPPPATVAVGDYVRVAGTVARPDGTSSISGPLFIDAREFARAP